MKNLLKVVAVLLIISATITGCNSKNSTVEKKSDKKEKVENSAVDKKDAKKLSLKAWQEDLKQLDHDLRWYNTKPFERYGEDAFVKMYKKLEKDLPKLSDKQREWRFRELIYSIGDGHIDMWKKSKENRMLPLMIDELSDGYYVINATKEYKDLIGTKVKTINDTPVKDLISNFEKISNSESKHWQRTGAIEKLHYYYFYDLINKKLKDDVVKINDKKVKLVNVDSLTLKSFVKKLNIGRLPQGFVRGKYTLETPYTHEWYNNDKLLVIRFSNHMDEKKGYSLFDFSEKVKKEIKKKNPKVLLVDFRDDGGGSVAAFSQFFDDEFFKKNGFTKKGRLFVATNRNTFSAGGISSALLKDEYGAIVIGTPTGGSPFTTNISTTGTKQLKNTGLFFRVSSAVVSEDMKNTPSLAPDKEIKYTIKDIMEDKNPIIDYVIKESNK
ncbi:MAG: hypothetical protein CSB15_01360 [Clostridiales bacterium]|nr:MAG: hypothetical protein CSB15_01360 [Clostridiales bacterium]